MLKVNHLKAGDIIKVNDDGTQREGVVVDVSHEDHQALVDNGVQEFWYDPADMEAIPLNEAELVKLGFEVHDLDGQGVKYSRGAFRLVTPVKGDFGHIEMWYREDKRHFDTPLFVHELQNHHLAMTKVPLDMP
jgi:hypothetical protein